MKNTRCETLESLSPSDVLAFLRDWYRFAEVYEPEFEPDVILSFDSTIEEWRLSCDLLAPRQLWPSLNSIFKIVATREEWLDVLSPDAKLGNLCNFVSAKGAQRHQIVAFRIAGVDCLEAGAFLALRSALADVGVPVANAKPSTSLGPLLDQHLPSFLQAMAKLAPGTVPIPVSRFRKKFGNPFGIAFANCLGLTCLMFFFFPMNFVLQMVISELVYFILIFALSNIWFARNYESDFYFEDMKSLADLARLMVPS